MKGMATRAFLISTLAGTLVWALSPTLTGHAEPWDAAPWFYPTALLLSGCCVGVFIPKPLWTHYLGLIFGQLLYELLFLNAGAFVLLGLMFMLPYALIFILAATFAAWVMRKIQDRH